MEVATLSDKSRIKAFLLRRDKLLTVIGAIIVFSTFLVREAAREHLKEVADSLSATQNAYLLSQNMVNVVGLEDTSTALEVAAASRKLLANIDKIPVEDGFRPFLPLIAKMLPLIPRWLGEVAFNLDQLSVLATKLKNHDTLNARLDREQKRIEQLRDYYDKMPSMTPAEIMDRKNEEQIVKAWSELEPAFNTFREFAKEYSALQTDIIREAREEKESAERWYTRCTWASYILYSIGWGLGLVGKIYGVGAAAGE
jgi:hypothetical protein